MNCTLRRTEMVNAIDEFLLDKIHLSLFSSISQKISSENQLETELTTFLSPRLHTHLVDKLQFNAIGSNCDVMEISNDLFGSNLNFFLGTLSFNEQLFVDDVLILFDQNMVDNLSIFEPLVECLDLDPELDWKMGINHFLISDEIGHFLCYTSFLALGMSYDKLVVDSLVSVFEN